MELTLKRILLGTFVSFTFLNFFGQAPMSIPYQAVVHNADGSVMANAALTLTFKIHDVAATGNVVYQETHSLSSNAQGLVVCAVGSGTAVQGTFAGIQWGSGAKFMHVLMNAGSGEIDLGTQQMMSVPFALYSNGVSVNVSTTGDTLSIGGNHVIVPGISLANVSNNNVATSGFGAVVLPGNTTCANEYISVTGCGGQTSLTYDGRTYDLVEIGGQCWFADNLATDQYRNGDPIPTGLSNTTWQNTTAGAYAIYNNDPANDVIYGKLYNWYTTADSRGLCPTGWHVPTDCDWKYLEVGLGMPIADLESYGSRGTIEGGALKSITDWNYPNTGANNSSGFTALPGGIRQMYGSYQSMGDYGYWWSCQEYDSFNGWFRMLDSDFSIVGRNWYIKQNGFSVRCIKD